jgi:hypothetical protein
MKSATLGLAIVLALAAAPATARHRHAATHYPAVSTYCATIDPGNPFSPYYDYQAWSKWRQRGGWDPTGDDRCFHNPLYSPTGTPTFVPTPYAYRGSPAF